jgi:hypothetical protein
MERAIEIEQRESEAAALKTQKEFRAELDAALKDPTVDPETKAPKGLLNRQLSQAKDTTQEFMQISDQLAKKYKAIPVAPSLRNSYDSAIDSHLESATTQVSTHEATQRDADVAMTVKTYTADSIATAGSVKNPDDLFKLIQSTQRMLFPMMKGRGINEDAAKFELRSIAGDMTKASVLGVLEENPKRAAVLLESVKGGINPTDYNELSRTIEGKLVNDENLAVWNRVSVMKRSDGTMDTGKMQEYVYSLPVTTERKQQIFSYVNSRASVADADFKESITANDRSFANDLVKLHADGASFEEALQLSVTYGRDSSDISEKQAQAKSLWLNKDAAFDTWIKAQPQEYQAAAEYAEMTFKSVYPKKKNTVKLQRTGQEPVEVQGADAAIQEFKLQALGKSPAQMRQLANDMAKQVEITTEHFWQNDDYPSWQVSAQNRLQIDEAMAKMENEYGVARVARAKIRLRKEGKAINPTNIYKLVNAVTPGAK